jgi:hypothetical protein
MSSLETMGKASAQHTDVLECRALWVSGQLHAELPLSDLLESVMSGRITVLHKVFPPRQLTELRDAVHGWGESVERKPAQTNIDENFHSIEQGLSPRQRTPHFYHAYNFNQIHALPSELSRLLLAVFEPLRIFQNALTNNSATFHHDGQGRKLHPQIIQYPRGGGMFGRHVHPLEPQKVGLILGISERGRDFESGAIHFDTHGADVGTEWVHNIGDMILFRFDIPHWITAVEPEVQVDQGTSLGRWTLVLPYY